MTAAREDVLAAVRGALGRGPGSPLARGLAGAGPGSPNPAEIDARLAAHAANLMPARARPEAGRRVALFVAEAERAGATVERVRDRGAVPGAVAAWLARLGLPTGVRVADDPGLRALPWAEAPTLALAWGRAEDGDAVALTGAVCGVAETGTLVLASGPGCPTTLAFLPATHVCVLDAADVVGGYEDAWARLRARGALPRLVTWITGPSRSADIEQQLLIGVHGPGRLHVVLIDGR